MGAKIEGAGTRRIVIEGVKELHGAEHTVIPDRIEAGTFLVAGAICGDGVTLRRVMPAHLEGDHRRCSRPPATRSIRRSRRTPCTIMPRRRPPKGVDLTTAPYPGFPTDMQAQMTARCSPPPRASASSRRPSSRSASCTCAELKRMGADIELDGGTAVITRRAQRSAARPSWPATSAPPPPSCSPPSTPKGTTEINRLYHIDRGYEHIDEKLGSLGAQMERAPE